MIAAVALAKINSRRLIAGFVRGGEAAMEVLSIVAFG